MATGSSSVRVEVVRTLTGLDGHADAWDRLALSAPERLPQLSHAWVASFLETCNPHGLPWYCLFAYRGTELVGVLPVLRARRWGVRRLVAPEDSHNEHGHPLLAPGAAADALDALVAALDELEPGLWMRFHRVRETSPLLEALAALEPRRLVLRPLVRTGSLVDTSGDLEAFEARLSRSLRRDLRKARRKAEGEYRVGVEVVTGQEAARPDLLADFLRVEATGWKGERGSAIACHPRRVDFYTVLTRRLAHRGWMEWHMLRFDGTVVAAVLAARLGTSLLLPKAGYDESLSRYSPGQLLYWEMFTRAFNDDTVEVNFLTDRAWMHLWHMQQSTYHDVLISPRTGLAAITSRIDAAEPRRRASRFAHRHPALLDTVRHVQARLRPHDGRLVANGPRRSTQRSSSASGQGRP